MSKKFLAVLVVLVSILVLPLISFAEITTTVSPLTTPAPTAEQIANLNRLYAEIVMLQTKINELKAQALGLQAELRLTKRLYLGSKDNEVKTLQRLLSTDNKIYPEGLITGYYGPLTERAVRKMQKKAGLAETGILNEHTIARINELLRDGAGQSGKIPPGLLRAPGIWKKLGLASTTTCRSYDNDGDCEDEDDDNDDDGDDDDGNDNNGNKDRTAPIVTSKTVTNVATSSAMINWITNEMTTGKVHYARTTPVVGQGGGFVEYDNTLGTNNSVTLDGLTASTTYYYYIKAKDSAGNSVVTPDANFTTTN